MASELRIGNKRIIPAPFVNVSKQINFTEDGQPISAAYNITLEGTLLPNRGSPTSINWHQGEGEPADENHVGDDARHNSLLAKQELLKEAFNTPGEQLSYRPVAGESFKCFPSLQSIDFEPGSWTTLSRYRISLAAPSLNRFGTDESEGDFIADASGLNLSTVADDFTVQELESNRVFSISRTTSASSRIAWRVDASGNPVLINGLEPWQQAKQWVTDRVTNYPLISVSGDTRFFVPSGIPDINDITDPSGAGRFYNFLEEESINKFAGSYSLSQRFTYSPTDYVETRSVQYSIVPTQFGGAHPTPGLTSISVQGSISGLEVENESNVSGRILAARNRLNDIVSGFGVGGPLSVQYGTNGNFISRTFQEDEINGVVTYSFEFRNTSGDNTFSHLYQISSTDSNNGRPAISIRGTVEGISVDDNFNMPNGGTKFQRAASGWTGTVLGSLKSLATANLGILGITNYTSSDLDAGGRLVVDYDPTAGRINYSTNFNYAPDTENYLHDYNVSFERGFSNTVQSSPYLVSANIEGTISPLPTRDGDISTAVSRSKTAWSAIKPNIGTLVSGHYNLLGTSSTDVGPRLNLTSPVSSTVSINTTNGTISYNVSFNNRAVTSNSAIAQESVTIEDVLATDVFAVQVIPGRMGGPIIQNVGTTNERKKTVNIALTLLPNSFQNHWLPTDTSTLTTVLSDSLLTTHGPTGTRGTDYFVESDSASFDPEAGFYTRSVSFVLR
jgi:hypothetical protein